jgi:hypothetical protein
VGAENLLVVAQHIECGAFGPIAASWTKARILHFVTVLVWRS